MKKNKILVRCFAVVVFLAIASPILHAEEGEENSAEVVNSVIIHVTGNYHAEARDYVGYADGFDVLAGVDFLLWPEAGLYAGPRLGWYAETVCTAYMAPTLAMYQKPSVGGQIYFTYPFRFFRALAGTAGFAFDVLVNLDDLHSDPGERFYLFTAAFLGLRLTITDLLILEARLEAGIFPFFKFPPVFIKGGLQVGVRL
jgi:hypothetical protein